MNLFSRISTQAWAIFAVGVVVAAIAAFTSGDPAGGTTSTSSVAMVSAVILLAIAGFLMTRDLRNN